MKKHHRFVYPFILLFIYTFITNCSSNTITVKGIQQDGEYDTQMPAGDVSDNIEEIGESVKLINSLVFYKRYHYNWSDKITEKDLQDENLLTRSKSISNQNKTASGTATIIGRKNNKLLLLTNAHIVFFPDTIISYFSNDSGKISKYIESVQIKQSQTNYAALVGVSNLEIVHLDKDRDVALVGCEITRPFPEEFKVFNYKIGDSNELQWGDFTYILGYPMHYKMLTTGVVSTVVDETEYFLLDVNVNRGASGGPVLAVRDGAPNFELVGIISLVPAEKRNILIPRQLVNIGHYQVDAEYKGDLIIGEIENVKYGVSRVVSIEAIKNSIRENYDKIIGKGYSLSSFNDLFGSSKADSK